jgi:hypothetical protein
LLVFRLASLPSRGILGLGFFCFFQTFKKEHKYLFFLN